MRRRLVWLGTAVVVAGLLSACAGKDDTTTVHSLSTAKTTSVASAGGTDTTTLVNGKPHFGSPEAAMRYLAAAWNANDLVSLKHVTDPSARDQLNNMHGVATNLRLNHCDANPAGDYTCYFDHDYPVGVAHDDMNDESGVGQAVFVAGPADTPGWYMTVFLTCN